MIKNDKGTDMELTLKKYDFLPPEALEIRIKVFVDEQGFCDEFDATDAVATHLVLFDGDSAVDTYFRQTSIGG